MNIIIIGSQASGKGTQADFIAKKLGIKHISTGDILREEKKSNSLLAKELKKYMDKGLLVPNPILNALIEKVLNENPKGVIFDGYPRTQDQASFLDSKTVIDKVIFLEVPDEVSIERISGRRICPVCGKTYHIKYNPPSLEGVCDVDNSLLVQRDDDKPEAIKKRLETYHSTTEPLLKYYSKKLVKINGDQGIEEVKKEIEQKLGISDL